MADADDRGRVRERWMIAVAALAVIAAACALGIRTLQLRESRARERIGDAVRGITHGSEIDRTTALVPIGAAVTNPAEFVEVFPHVIQAMKDESQMVRGAALSAAGGLIPRYCQKQKFGIEHDLKITAICSEAGPALAAMLDDPSPVIRAGAAGALGGLADARRLDAPPPRLVESLDDEDESVRKSAAAALTRYSLGPELLVPVALRRLPTEGRLARPEFAWPFQTIRLEPSVLPLLIEGLSSEDPGVCLSCTTAINHMGRDANPALPAILTLLRKELETPHPSASHSILAMASGAIGEISTDGENPPGAVELLCEVLKRPNDAGRASDPDRPGSPGPSASATGFKLAEAAWSLGILGRSAASSVPLLTSTFEAAPEKSELLRGIIAEALVEITRGTPDEDRVIATLATAWKTAPRSQRPVLARALRNLGPKSEQAVPELRQLPPDDTRSKIRRVRYPRSGREDPVSE
jgi:HEAT repeat protein